MNTRSAACVALGIVRRVTFQYRVMADKEELKTLFSLWQKVSRTITSFITLLFRSGLIIFVLLVIAFSVQAECHFGRVFGRRFCFVRIIWQNIRFDQTFLPKMPFCQILVSAETVTVTVLQLYSNCISLSYPHWHCRHCHRDPINTVPRPRHYFIVCKEEERGPIGIWHLSIHNSQVHSTGRMGWMAHMKWKEALQLPGTAGPGNMLGCCSISFHFLWAIHPIIPVHTISALRLSSVKLVIGKGQDIDLGYLILP